LRRNTGGPQRHRTVIEDDLFLQQAQAIEPNPERLDEMLDGLKWGLARQPDAHPFYPIPETELWQAIIGPPPFRVRYTIEEDTVTLRSIERIPGMIQQP
jgi:hypothetical protein